MNTKTPVEAIAEIAKAFDKFQDALPSGQYEHLGELRQAIWLAWQKFGLGVKQIGD